VIEENEITLPCRNKLGGPMRWLYTKSIDSPQNVLFNGETIESKYVDRITARVDQTSGNYNLLLNNVRLNQSGLYICVEDWGVLHKYPIVLDVLGKYCTLSNMFHCCGTLIVIFQICLYRRLSVQVDRC